MQATLKLPRRATYADYLAAETLSPFRHEFFDGVIVAMAGGSDEPNAIASRLAVVLFPLLRAPCRSYSSDQRFWIAAQARARYSDGSIICGAPEHPPHDPQATTNPTIVFEVLSPSSEGDDDGEKRRDFQSLPSLRSYLLIAQDERVVKVYRRGERGEWSPDAELYRDGDELELPTLGGAFPVASIYDGILDGAGRSLLR
jgi:Uma2 family endonuclease